MQPILQRTDKGFYCPPGDFYIDPYKPVDRAIITHAHADHARSGHRHYLTAADGFALLKHRMLASAQITPLPYAQSTNYHGVRISLHPAGHVLGSAQVRIEHKGQIAVITGDYKVEPDQTCAPFEPLNCHLIVSESTFALPIYQWQPQSILFDQINRWWATNQDQGLASVLMAYSLGKAQRLLAGIDPTIGPIYCHSAIEPINQIYRDSGIDLPQTLRATDPQRARSLVLAPPSALASPWMSRFRPFSTAFASGWMAVRSKRNRPSVDTGFVLSDHADWNGLISSIKASGAQEVWLTHGYSAALARYLREIGLDAKSVDTRFRDESSSTGHDPAGNPPDSVIPELRPAGEQ